MIGYVLDTDMLSLWQNGHSEVARQVSLHNSADLGTTVITVQEQIDGWHKRLNRVTRDSQVQSTYDHLIRTVQFLGRLTILGFTVSAIQEYRKLRSLKLNIGRMDMRIAAIALDYSVIIVTRNARDFQRVPGLTIEDWSR